MFPADRLWPGDSAPAGKLFYWPGGVIQPNGGKLDLPCADFWYIENGKIKEFNCHASLDVMFRQVGGKTVFPSDGAASAARPGQAPSPDTRAQTRAAGYHG